MNKDVFRTLIIERQEVLQEVELFERPFEFEEQGRYVLVGIRQAGKSYLLYQRAKQLMEQGHAVQEYDEEGIMETSGLTIEIVPVWKWLLQ